MYPPEFVTKVRAIDLHIPMFPSVFREGRRRWVRTDTERNMDGSILSAFYVVDNDPDYPEVLHVVQ